MAIPEGTTHRQFGAMARWALVGLAVLAMLSWWWPSYYAWGALGGGLLLVWALWLTWKTLGADRKLVGQPGYLVLAVPAAILVYHLTGTAMGRTEHLRTSAWGAMNLSMLYQLGLIALGMLLAQSLLPGGVGEGMPLVLGGAMMGGSAAATVWGPAAPVQSAVAMLGFAGAAVWVSPLWPSPVWALSVRALPVWGASEQGQGASVLAVRQLRLILMGVAAVAVALLSARAPRQAMLALGIVAASVAAVGPAGGARGLVLRLAAAMVAVLAAALLAGPEVAEMRGLKAGFFGRGAFVGTWAADDGLKVLTVSLGWVGSAWLVGSAAICMAWMGQKAGRCAPGGRGRAIAWVAAAGLALAALLSPGGLSIPAASVAVAVIWGLLPPVLCRPCPPRSGLLLAVVAVGLMMLLGISDEVGLAIWSAASFGLGDKFLHMLTGFFLAMIAAWLMGARSTWWGLVGISLAALAGGAGEGAQQLASARGGDWADWGLHLIGSGAALPVYLLSMGARWCESPDALPPEVLAEHSQRLP